MATYTYSTNIPAPGNNPSNDVTPMQTNTNSINSIIGTDHVGFNLANGGFHSLIHLKDQGTATPVAVSNFGELWVFKADDGLANAPLLYFGSGTNAPSIRMTRNFTPSRDVNGNGATFLPGGLIMNFGRATAVVTTGTNVLFTQPFTANNPIITTGVGSGFVISNISNTGFKATANSGGPIAFNWMAIGT